MEHLITSVWHTDWSVKRSATCAEIGCSGWLPKQGRDALVDAMEKNGWDYVVSHRQGIHSVRFFKVVGPDWAQGEDADECLAAAKAMKAAGY